MGRLTALSVRNAKPGRHGDGAGLYLMVKPTGARSWILRIQQDGKRRDIGIGSTAALSLAEARECAAELRKHALNGRDPIAERDRDRRPTPTFREASRQAYEALKSGWSQKNADAFLTSLETYAFPAIGNVRVDMVDAGQVRDMLAAFWTSKPEQGRKVRMRVGQVLNFSHAKGWRASEAPARSVTVGLPKQAGGKNYRSMPYSLVPGFVSDLRAKTPTSGRGGLYLLVLTAARPGEIRRARWGQFDLEKAEWVRPADMMKSGEAHTVTLSTAAVAFLRELHTERSPKPDDLVFPGQRGAVMSDMAMTKVLRDAKVMFDAHGFRSSFRDWAAEQHPEIPDAVAEAALAHAVPDKVVRAYKRTKFIEMRRGLLEAWGCFVTRSPA